MTTTNNNVNEEERKSLDSPVAEALQDYFEKQGYLGLKQLCREIVEDNASI